MPLKFLVFRITQKQHPRNYSRESLLSGGVALIFGQQSWCRGGDLNEPGGAGRPTGDAGCFAGVAVLWGPGSSSLEGEWEACGPDALKRLCIAASKGRDCGGILFSKQALRSKMLLFYQPRRCSWKGR